MMTGKRIEWAIIVSGILLLTLLLFLFGYSQAHTDDFSYLQFAHKQGFLAAQDYLFRNSGGRFLSSSILLSGNLFYENYLRVYPIYTSSLFVVLVALIGIGIRLLFKNYFTIQTQLSLALFVCLLYFSFTPDIHELLYWLAGSATYTTSLIFLLGSTLIQFLQIRRSNTTRWFVLFLLHVGLCGCSEAGVLLYIPVLAFCTYYHFFYRQQSKAGFILSALGFLAGLFFVALSPGSHHRQAVTPYSGHLLLAAGGGIYATLDCLLQWIWVLLPCMWIGTFLYHKSPDKLHFRFAGKHFGEKRYVTFLAGILYFMLCQMIIVWMSGSIPEKRAQNVFFFALLLWCLLFAPLAVPKPLLRLPGIPYLTASVTVLALLLILSGNHYKNALLDIADGKARQFREESIRRYQTIRNSKTTIVSVKPVTQRPESLYYPTFSCVQQIDETDIPRKEMAEYFGKAWIYEYPCSTTPIREPIPKRFLKQIRAQYFSTKTK